MTLIDGAAIAQEVEREVKADIEVLPGRPPCLAVVIVGEHPASKIYVGKKTTSCQRVGITSRAIPLPDTVSQEELLARIVQLNEDLNVDGILVQLPLPKHIDVDKVIETLEPSKDVDGFHPVNVGRVFIGRKDAFAPCTPLGIHYLLIRSHVDLTGKHVVIVGRSNIVGKPLAALLIQNSPHANATVTVAHSHTHDLPSLTRQADVLVAAVGRPGVITKDMVRPGAVVIDVGINRVPDPSHPKGSRVKGDVDFEAVKEVASLITPVPGGVGPMTIAMLLKNTLHAYHLHHRDYHDKNPTV